MRRKLWLAVYWLHGLLLQLTLVDFFQARLTRLHTGEYRFNREAYTRWDRFVEGVTGNRVFKRVGRVLRGWYRASALRLAEINWHKKPFARVQDAAVQTWYDEYQGRTEPPSGDAMWSGDDHRPAWLTKEDIAARRSVDKARDAATFRAQELGLRA